MPPPKRDHNPSGLGRAIINRKAKDARRMHETGNYSVDDDTTGRLKSVTHERDLDEFLNTAELAGTDFTAERRNVKIIQQSVRTTQNPYLLTEQEEAQVLKKHAENKKRLRVPRRPDWTRSMTAADVDRNEKAAFLEWRRGLAQLQEEEKFLLTPFERNIEVWRQLWRVLERSHLVVQIVDARNPLRFRCEDLEDYVKDVEGNEGEAGTGKGKRRSLLLINKADLLTAKQRCQWADYFDSQGIRYAFYSAADAAALQQARLEALQASSELHDLEEESESSEDEESQEKPTQQPSKDEKASIDEEAQEESTDNTTPPPQSEEDNDAENERDYHSEENDDEEESKPDPRAQVLSVVELEDLMMREAPPLSDFRDASGKPPTKLSVGLVGYPNVGKSSTINSLLGEKKVSVSSTPGKTKHFQTIHLSESIVLCDCPGLVFPQFATTNADLICDGVLPIDQMREYTGPVSLLVKRLPQELLEAIYGLSIKVRSFEEGGDGKITASDFLISYAIARGYMRASQGNPDEARAARYILKDYVNAKLLFCHPPPGIDEAEFNQKTREIMLDRATGKKKAPVTRVGKDSDTFVATDTSTFLQAQGHGFKSNVIDDDFFGRDPLAARPKLAGSGAGSANSFSRGKFYPHQNALANDGTPLGFKNARVAALLENAGSDKKHHKKMKRVKQRSGKGYD